MAGLPIGLPTAQLFHAGYRTMHADLPDADLATIAAAAPDDRRVERRLADGSLRHCGSTLLRWNVGNVVVERRGNAVSIGKATLVGAGKIDGVAATLTAVAALLDAPAQPDLRP